MSIETLNYAKWDHPAKHFICFYKIICSRRETQGSWHHVVILKIDLNRTHQIAVENGFEV